MLWNSFLSERLKFHFWVLLWKVKRWNERFSILNEDLNTLSYEWIFWKWWHLQWNIPEYTIQIFNVFSWFYTQDYQNFITLFPSWYSLNDTVRQVQFHDGHFLQEIDPAWKYLEWLWMKKPRMGQWNCKWQLQMSPALKNWKILQLADVDSSWTWSTSVFSFFT